MLFTISIHLAQDLVHGRNSGNMWWVKEENRTPLCWVGQKVWVFSKVLQKNPNRLFGQPNINCSTANLGWAPVPPTSELWDFKLTLCTVFLFSCCMEKTLMLGGIWGQEEKGMTEDEMAGWHHRLNGHEFEWTPGVSDGQGSLACCDSWGCKESDTTERLYWTELKRLLLLLSR